MKKIKTVKIKELDGSISDESYTIAADAKNIDMANGYNLQRTVGTIDINEDGNIAEQLKNLDTDRKDNNIKINKKPYYYNTVADMKSDNSLKVGDMVITLGYYSVNDTGGADYRIVTGNYVDDGGKYHELNNGLFAQLVVRGNTITPLQFGAKHDEITDDYLPMQKCLNMLANGEASILDLKGYRYIINHGLYLDAMYKVIIKDGQLISTDFVFDDEDETKNYIMYETGNGTIQPGSYGYQLEDVIFDTITFECYQQEGLGCVYLRKYFRLTFFKCDFRRFMTYGIKDTYILGVDGHELLVSHCWFRGLFNDDHKRLSPGVAIEIAHGDNTFRDLIIGGTRIGINLLGNASFNQFSNIHFYQFLEYALKISQTCLTFDQMYFDNNGVYIEDPWYVTFTNCMWLGGANETFAPITLAKKQGVGAYREIHGVYFYGCVLHLYNPNTLDLCAFPHGTFRNLSGDNVFQFHGYGFNNNMTDLSNNTEIVVDNRQFTFKNGFTVKTKKLYDEYNPFKINTDSTPYFFFDNGATITTVNRYTYKVADNELNVTDYDSTNYTWIGFLVELKQNSTYRISNRYNHNNTHLVVYGYNSTESGTTGTRLKSENSNEWMSFDTGEYDYYFVSFFGKGKYDIVLNEVLS